MATKKTPIKKQKVEKSEPKTVYFVAFYHGKQGERDVENIEIDFVDVPEITQHNHVKSLEVHLTKNFVNPKVINFIPLRTR